ncbi:MAG: hypothetical protein WCO00_12175 [Rhodospirillaceae bacterium]
MAGIVCRAATTPEKSSIAKTAVRAQKNSGGGMICRIMIEIIGLFFHEFSINRGQCSGMTNRGAL